MFIKGEKKIEKEEKKERKSKLATVSSELSQNFEFFIFQVSKLSLKMINFNFNPLILHPIFTILFQLNFSTTFIAEKIISFRQEFHEKSTLFIQC